VIFLVDTNTFCEAAKPEPNRRVLSRLVSRQFDWATSATAWEEFLAGIGALPRSERRSKLEAYGESLLEAGLDVLPFDRSAAEWMGPERARLAKRGITPAYRDAQIAAVAATHKLIVVTRNVDDFRSFSGVRVQNWFG
jgi:predicted nucleic acid-binding protein